MDRVVTPSFPSHRRTALAANSGPFAGRRPVGSGSKDRQEVDRRSPVSAEFSALLPRTRGVSVVFCTFLRGIAELAIPGRAAKMPVIPGVSVQRGGYGLLPTEQEVAS